MLTLVLASIAGCNRDPNVRKQKYLESGKRYEAEGKYREAAVQFLNALKVDKNYGDAHYEMSKTYLKMNSPQPAYSELLKAVQSSPNNVQARIDLGNLLLDGRVTGGGGAGQGSACDQCRQRGCLASAGVAQQKGDNATAMQNIQHAMEIDPNRAAFHTEAALLQTADPANEAAVETELGKAASLDSKDATPHLVLAALLEKKGDLAGAEQQYASAITIAPQNTQARAALAGLYIREGKKDNAEETLKQAVGDLPDSEEAATLLRITTARRVSWSAARGYLPI